MTERMRVKGRFATRAQIEAEHLRQADIDFLDSLFADPVFQPVPDPPPDPDTPPTQAELEQVQPMTEVALELGRLHEAGNAVLHEAARHRALAGHAMATLASVAATSGISPPPRPTAEQIAREQLQRVRREHRDEQEAKARWRADQADTDPGPLWTDEGGVR